MSVTSSPRQDISELLRRGRILSVIPKDQQNLLERPGSWAVDLKNAPHGLANVPGHVLETTVQAYRARRDTRPSRYNSPDGSERSNHENGDAGPSSSRPETEPRSPPEREISWSKSPEPAQPELEAPTELPVVRETPKPASMAPPPLPKPQLQQAPAFDDDLQNSDEEDLEVELPHAQAQLDVIPVNMAAAGPAPTPTPTQTDSTQAVETPPCAQPSQKVVPDTVVKRASPPAKPAEGRRRRHKPIELTSSPIKAVIPTVAPRRMPTTKTFLNDMSSSHSTSSSMVPATNSSLGSVRASVEHCADILVVTVEQETGRADVHMDDVVGATQQDHAARPETAADQPTPDPPVKQPAPARGFAPLNQQLNPYEAFAVAYPDYVTTYEGSLWNFVRACVYIEFLQKERSLRQCLYDDFIRAFSGYLRYYDNAGPGQEPLPAIEWFNNIPGPALYNGMVITSRDLEYIFNCFQNEVGRARQYMTPTDDAALEKGRAQKKPAQPKSTLHPRQRKPPPNFGLDGAMDVDPPEGAVPEAAAPAQPPSQPQTPPTLHPRRPLTQLPLPPSPQLGSESPAPTATPAPAATPTASAPSRYLERLASRTGVPRKRSAEDMARLRDHIRKRQASRALSSSNSKAR